MPFYLTVVLQYLDKQREKYISKFYIFFFFKYCQFKKCKQPYFHVIFISDIEARKLLFVEGKPIH